MSPFDEIKPYFVAKLNDRYTQDYVSKIEQAHSRKPTEAEMSNFIAVLVATGNIDKEAEELSKDFINKIINQNRLKNIFINTSITLPVCSLLGLLISFLYKKEIPISFQSGAIYYTTLVAACIWFLITIVITVMSFIK